MNDSDDILGCRVSDQIIRSALVRTDEEEPGVIIWSANAPEQIGALVKRITAGHWVRDSPTLTGWYWFQAKAGWVPPIKGLLLRPDTPPAILIVGEDLKGRLVCNFPQSKIRVTDMDGYWCGPLRLPQ